jgi:hypothetical protein
METRVGQEETAMTVMQDRRPFIIPFIIVAILVALLPIVGSYEPSFRQHATAVPRDIRTEYVDAMWQNVQFMAANGISSARIPSDLLNQAMPPIPNCEELTVCPENSEWDAFVSNGKDGKPNLVTVELKSNGEVIGRHEFMRVSTADYEQTFMLHARGHESGWISNIQVVKAARGNGLGRLMVKAGDAALKLVPGGTVHIFVDNAGWASRVLDFVPEEDWIIKGVETVWAYVIR